MTKKRKLKKARIEKPEPERKKRIWSFQDPHNLLPWMLAALALCAGVFAFDSRLSLSGDNAEFIILGRSVAEGHGLTYVNTPDMRPATKYPFGFPFLLAIVHLLNPHSILSMKLLVLFAFVVSIPLLYRYVLRETSLLVATLVAVMAITCHFVLDYSHQVMSEIPYLLASILALLALESAVRHPTRRSLALAVLAVMAAYYIRSVGIALIAGGAAYFALNRLYREGGIFLAGSILLALPWQIRTSMLGGESYAKTWLFRVNPYRPDEGEIGWMGLIERIYTNAQLYTFRELPIALFPAWITEQIPIVIGLSVGALLVYFIVIQTFRRRLTGIYVLLYMGACFLWPTVWTDVRLLTPVLPLVFMGIIVSCQDLIGRLWGSIPTGISLAVIAGAVIVPNAYTVTALAGQEHRYSPEWSTYFEAGRWIEQNTEEDVVVGCRKAFLMSVISKRQTTSYALTEDYDAVLASLEQGRADLVVVDQLQFNSTSRYLLPTIERHRDRFRYVHVIPDPDTYILKLD